MANFLYYVKYETKKMKAYLSGATKPSSANK